jgi:hypothetical protein
MRSNMRSSLFLQTVRTALVAMALTAMLGAQEYSQINKVEPASVKVGDNVTLHGDGLGKKRVVAVFLSTDKDDIAVVIVEQTDTKIVIKIPKVKAGDYKLGLEVEKTILIQPKFLTIE